MNISVTTVIILLVGNLAPLDALIKVFKLVAASYTILDPMYFVYVITGRCFICWLTFQLT
jgi:hypothetical protein